MLMKSARVLLANNLARLMAQSTNLRSARQLALRARVAQTTISNWLRIDRAPTLAPQLSALEAVARAFGISVGELLSEPENDELVVRLRSELEASRAHAYRVSRMLYELAALLESGDAAVEPAAREFRDPGSAELGDYLLSGAPPSLTSRRASANRKK
ncbi:helix-turn-helix domain-containing protein [Ralstonia pseudosolanacearum]|uniref:helix-turn-helix domain-containing protein n=1 Tax=Ralstonia pseudosolanacearum TaxID=1310165 RepID=UPI001FFA8626|nr:helix-turn-helix transcriptional regulator [Ralstonia pseudosolanacearum]